MLVLGSLLFPGPYGVYLWHLLQLPDRLHHHVWWWHTNISVFRVLKVMTGSNHQVKCSYYSHQIPMTGIADFLCLPQAGIASLSLFVLHLYLTRLLSIFDTHFCHISFLSTPISLLLPQRLVALWVPCSTSLIYALGTYAITYILETLMGLFAFSFPDLDLWLSSNLLIFFLLANSIPPLVYCLSLCLTHAQQITLVPWRWSGLNRSVELHQQI